MTHFNEKDAIDIKGANEKNDYNNGAKIELPETEDEPEDENTKLGKELFTSALKSLNSSALRKSDGWAKMKKAADLGNTDAKVKVAFTQLLGNDYVSQDLEMAKTTFEDATNKEGHPEAQFGLGFLYATGTMTNSSQATALLYYTFAAFGGNSWAQMALGYVIGKFSICLHNVWIQAITVRCLTNLTTYCFPVQISLLVGNGCSYLLRKGTRLL